MDTLPPHSEALSDDTPDLADSAQRLESLFDDARGEILGTLYYLVGNMEDARDALQETFLKCWRHRQQIDNVQNLKAWVFRIALNTGRDTRKAAWNRRRESLAEDAVMVSTADGPESGLMQDEELRRLQHAVLQLRPEEQSVFLLRQNGELTYEQIAEATSLPIGTVKTRMRTAIRQLRQSVGGQS
ncbi:MAG: RNA polymerase sigma factor [Pirellulaceae bacterium]